MKINVIKEIVRAMKTIYTRRRMLRALVTILVLCVATSFVACDSALEEEPESFLSSQQVFRSEEGAISAVKGVYQPLRNTNYYAWWFTGMVEMHADYVNGRGSQAPVGNYQIGATNINRIGFVWSEIYESINRANIVIANVPNVSGISPTLRDQLIAEARFVRALGYFHLVRLWGDVPLRTTPTIGTEALAVPRSPTDEVYSVIIEDAQFGEAHLPDSYDMDNIGRATRWAAKILLAKVNLTRERWSEAAAKAKEIMDSGMFELVRVETSADFDKIFGPDVITHSEEIFAIKYLRDPDLGSEIPWLLHRPGAGYSSGGVFAWPGEPESWIGDWPEDSPDLRRNFNLYNGADTVFLSPEIPMLFKKYKDPQAPAQSGHANDLQVFRYAEALLIFAEAESMASGGPTSEAHEAINMVRRRAYGKDPNIPDPGGADIPAGMTADEFRDVVMLERAKEFVMEAKRWFDLLRTDTALEIIQGLGKPISAKNLKWPIPDEELDNNDALTQADQNPGW